MSETDRCPECGTELAPGASPGGLCPKCLMKQALGSEVAPEGEPERGSGTLPMGETGPLDVSSLVESFPQLEVMELLGRGGMGVVYKARQRELDRLVALKILPLEAEKDPAFAERFTREAQALARLSHPGIVAVHDFGKAGAHFYFIMEYVDGTDLRRLMQRAEMTAREALEIVPQICDALQYAHDEGIVHRDIKPENVLLDKKGRVKIADFGLARILGQKAEDFRLTGTRQIMGTPHYMAPEQIEKPQEVDHRADIYSLGVVFYEMLTGELPLGRFEPPSKKVQVDVRLDEIVLRTLEKEPDRRYQHVSDVKSDVESIAARTAPTPSEEVAKLGPRSPVGAVLYSVAALTVLLACVVAYRLGFLYNILNILILLLVPITVSTRIWGALTHNLEYRLLRRPLSRRMRLHLGQCLNRWIFLAVYAELFTLSIIPVQFDPVLYQNLRMMMWGSVAILMVLQLIPRKRIRVSTNALFAVGWLFLGAQIIQIFLPPSASARVVLDVPFRDECYIFNGGRSSLINLHYPFANQRHGLDIVKLVNNRRTTGSLNKLESFTTYGQELLAPAEGRIARAVDDLPDLPIGESDVSRPVGNHLVIEMEEGKFVLLGHLMQGSITVSEGDWVLRGQPVARSGNSGNSSEPHVHVQVQNQVDFGAFDLKTFPIVFRNAIRTRGDKVQRLHEADVRRNDRVSAFNDK